MNDHSEDLEQPLFDKLVDGELSSAEQRAVLQRLEDEPHGWRRLALTFLEAQAWQRDLPAAAIVALPAPMTKRAASAVVSEPPQRVPVRPVGRPPLTLPRRRWSAFTAIAASACVVFGLGFACGSLRPAGDAASIAARPITSNSVAQEADRIGDNVEPGPDSIRLYLAGDTPDTYREMDLPIVELNDDESAMLAAQTPFVPEQVRRTLERMGHEIQEERQLIPLQLPDGREGVVPVDNVHVRYVGQRDYQ
jgi:hypothetical protein